VLVVFATNNKPAELVDEAFLRRIQYKVQAESPTREDFLKIWQNYCRDANLEYDRALVETLIDTEIAPRNIALRGCQPRDLIEHALALSVYLDEPRKLTLELLSAASGTYFIDEREVSVV
jgi:SpoVK/Ycf46/Vps4 family AAA+-type ATPase